MTIEIHSPNLIVDEKTIDRIKQKVLTLSHVAEKVSRAEIFLTEDTALPKENKTCKIRLSIYGDDLFVQKHADSFEIAAVSAIKVLRKLLKKKTGERNLPSDQVTSTVKV